MTFIESLVPACRGHKCMDRVVRGAGLGPGISGHQAQRPPASVTVLLALKTLHTYGEGPSKCTQKEGVHNVHTLGFGFGCTGIGLGRIGEVFGGVAGFQGSAPGSSPTSGTVFSQV